MTMQITLDDYFTGPGNVRRDVVYAADLTNEIRDNAAETVRRVNLLLAALFAAGVPLATDPHTGSLSHSGWRPPEVNAATAGAARKSNHLLGKADDIYDPRGLVDAWCMSNLDRLEAIGLWLEHPRSTPGWCHVQIVPPRSGKRVFLP